MLPFVFGFFYVLDEAELHLQTRSKSPLCLPLSLGLKQYN